MPSYSVDSIRQPMTATGIVDPVLEWEETPDGKRRPSDRQARNQDTGMPLWGVEVLYIQSSFGRRATVTAKVTVESPEEPKAGPLTPIAFEGLQVEVRTNRAGALTETWTATSVLEPAKQPRSETKPEPGAKAA